VNLPKFPLHQIISDGTCSCRKPGCDRVGKHPSVLWGSFNDPTYEPKPGEGYGFRLTGSDIVVIDCDRNKPDKPGVDGVATLFAKAKELGQPFRETHTVQTGSGGIQLYYRARGLKFTTCKSESTKLPGIDVRGEGGYVVGPGSPHKSGGTYKVIDPRDPVEIPQWLADLLPKNDERETAIQLATAISREDPTYASRCEIFREVCRNEKLHLCGQGDNEEKTFILIQKAVRGLRLQYEDGREIFESEYNARLPEKDKWIRDDQIRHKFTDAATAGKTIRIDETWHANAFKIGLPEILTNLTLHDQVLEACKALGRAGLYQRSGDLVRVVRVADTEADAKNVAGTPRITGVPVSTLKIILSRVANWKALRKDGGKVDVSPPEDVVAGVAQKQEWASVRPLTAIVEAPTMRPDGSIVQDAGYDSATGVLFEPGDVAFPSVPDAPTQGDAWKALEDLNEVFCDFPFRTDQERMVPIAALLSVLGRPAISGNVPAFVFEAPTRGSGKSLVSEAISIIATGREISKATLPSTLDELEKIIGGYARQARALFSWDNVDRPFGGAPLDKALTCGGVLDSRTLGKSEVPTFRWSTVMIATGNNIELCGDIGRRILLARIQSDLENPEDRTNFKHPLLLAWVRENRARLVTSALTIMRGYVAAGRPSVGVGTWGSFETWSRLVPSAIVWAGGADAQKARPAEDAEPEKMDLAALLNAWKPEHDRRTAKELLASPLLNEILTSIVPTEIGADRAKRLGRRLKKWSGRTVGGRRLVSEIDATTKVAKWIVEGC
jgi:hypothetical protein